MPSEINSDYPSNYQPFDETPDQKDEEIFDTYIENQRLKTELGINEKTGLPNQKSLDKFVEDYDSNPYCGVIATYIDLKDFGEINRLIGHAAADKKIYQFAQGLNTVIRASDKLFHLHGDEFVLLSPKKNDSDSPITPEQGLNNTLISINSFSETKFEFESVTFDQTIHKSLKDTINEADEKLMNRKQVKREAKKST